MSGAFLRVMRDPVAASDEEIESLTDHEASLFALRCDIETESLTNVLLRRAGAKPRPSKHRLSTGRLEELCAEARNGGSPSTIPLDEFALLCACPEQLAAYEAALGEGFDRLLGCAADDKGRA